MENEEIKVWFVNFKAEQIIQEFAKRFEIENKTLADDLEEILQDQVDSGNAARITNMNLCKDYREMGWKMVNLYPIEALPVLTDVLKKNSLKTDSMG